MTTIHFVRHGFVPRLAADSDPGLTPVGRRQAEATAAHFAAGRIDAVFTSDLRRARETAAFLAGPHSQPVQIDSRLRERANYDAAAGMSLDKFLAAWNRACVDRHWQPPVGISSYACGVRMEAFCRHCREQLPDRVILAATHGGAIADFLTNAFPLTEIEHANPALAADLYDGRVMRECSITTIAVDTRGVTLIAAAETGHLP